jgi:regulatory protein
MIYKITALKQQKRNHQRVNVYLDGSFAFGLTRTIAAWLQVGQEINDEKIAQLKVEDGREIAYQKALNLLNYRPRTSEEIRKKLHKKEINDADIEYVLKRLQRSKLIDDEAFAHAWVENRSDMRPRGKRALAYELRQRGIESNIIEKAIESVDEEELAYRAALKRARRLRNLEFNDFRRKLYSHLSQRGFGYDITRTAIERVWEQERGTKIEEEETL